MIAVAVIAGFWWPEAQCEIVNIFVLYLLLVKATLTSFSGLASLPMVRNDFVVRRAVLTDRQLNTAVAAGRTRPWTARHLCRQPRLPGGWGTGRVRPDGLQ